MKQKILLIEDDEMITEFMTVVLEKENYEVTVVENGLDALQQIQIHDFELILLDLGLPDIDGIELLKLFRKRLSIPIIIISARNNELGKVEVLDLGADDYVTKPFGTRELLARIRTALRHTLQRSSNDPIIRSGELTIDLDKNQLYKNQKEIHLTKNEFRICKILFENLGKVVTYHSLMTAVWGPYSGDQQILRVNLSNIRKKIEETPLEPHYLVAEIGVGYRLRDHNVVVKLD